MFRTSIRRRIISRILIALVVFGLALTFISTPSAHAATTTNGLCFDNYLATGTVYDSYNHFEGWIDLVHNSCTNGVYGAFIGNTNTWHSVTVYVEYAYVYGYLQGGPYGWRSNGGFTSPSYYTHDCYYAMVNLVDNRLIQNWFGTATACT